MAKRKSIQLDQIPLILQQAVALMKQQMDQYSNKELTSDDAKTIIEISKTLTAIYKDYRQEVMSIEKDLKSRTKEEINELIRLEK
jgi:hypothetical protein